MTNYNRIWSLLLVFFLPFHVFSSRINSNSLLKQTQRDTLSFSHKEMTINSNWEFVLNDTLNSAEINQLENWQKINLPHTWNKEDVIDEVEGYKRGIGWYRKEISLESNGQNNIFLKFEGANAVTEVFVNGSKAGGHEGGYTAFVIDITKFVSFEKKNKILIKVNNSHNANIVPLSADFNFYGGIYRDVWLVRKKEVHFDLLDKSTKGIYANTPIVSNEMATLNIKANIRNLQELKKDLTYGVKVFDARWKLIDEKNVKLDLNSQSVSTTEVLFNIKNPELWSPDSPVLYNVETSLYDAQGNLLDQLIFKKGFRWFEMDKNRGFVLNGKPLKLIGVNRHQDYKNLGNAMPDRLHLNDIDLIKKMGSNFIRISHCPQDPAVLEACDEKGLLVWEEIPIVNYITVSDHFEKVSKNMLIEMIRQHYNHTSVIMWGFMNEVLLRLSKGLEDNPQHTKETYLKEVKKLAAMLHNLAKEEDPARWTAIAHHQKYEIHEEAGLNEITDIVGWNIYSGWYGSNMDKAGEFLDHFHKNHPDKGILIAEYGGGSDPRINALDPIRFDFSIEWQTAIHASYYRQMMDRPYVMGGALWCFADFYSEKRKDAVPNVNSKGVINLDRSLKDSYLFYQAALSDLPFLEIGSLDWRSREGFANEKGKLMHPVYVFTNSEKIEVWLNDEKLKTCKVDDFHVRIMIPFQHGENTLMVKSADGLTKTTSFEANIHPTDLKKLLPKEIDIKMNLGAHFYYTDDITREIWLPEQPYKKGNMGYVGGSRVMTKKESRVGTDAKIFGTHNDPLYQTLRESMDAFKADVPDGWYEIELLFAEIYSKKERKALANNLGTDIDDARKYVERAFSVILNDEEILKLENFEDYRATPYKFRVRATENKGLTIKFDAKQGNTMLSALSIRGL